MLESAPGRCFPSTRKRACIASLSLLDTEDAHIGQGKLTPRSKLVQSSSESMILGAVTVQHIACAVR